MNVNIDTKQKRTGTVWWNHVEVSDRSCQKRLSIIISCIEMSALKYTINQLFMPRHSKNGGGALSVTPVRACVRPSVRYQNLVSAQ